MLSDFYDAFFKSLSLLHSGLCLPGWPLGSQARPTKGSGELRIQALCVYKPYASSNRNTSIEKCFKKHEQEKKRAYEQRIIDVEHASFTPRLLSQWWAR